MLPEPRQLRRFTVHADGTVFGPSGQKLSPFPVKGYLRVTRFDAGTDADVYLIRSMAGSSTEVAPLFGITPSTVRSIRNRRLWSHIA